jgi:hypothetical protein
MTCDVVEESESCFEIARSNGITLNVFFELNPLIDASSCGNLVAGDSYCVESNTVSTENALIAR